MSFGYAVGDVIAVLGLFERIAIELRNYKDAPAHFQNLSLELDLIRNTLQQVIRQEPENDADHETLEQIRSIILHCQQPLQTWAAKMRSKEASLGHFRSTKSLGSIGTRIHWSMIAKNDIDELRKTILSEMGAIMLLMSVRQMNQIQRLAKQVAESHTASSSLVRNECSSISCETSKILSMVSMTPRAIAELQAVTTTHSKQHTNQILALEQGIINIKAHMDEVTCITTTESSSIRRYVTHLGRRIETFCKLLLGIKQFLLELAKCSTKMLAVISRNTMLLLDIAGQLKRSVHFLEALPLHLNLDFVRLDDALGESWALPFQACQTYDSFRDMLLNVVYANNRPGLEYIKTSQFAIILANKGVRLGCHNWTQVIKAGIQIEQSMIVSTSDPSKCSLTDQCPYSDCNGSLAKGVGSQRNICLLCGRWTETTITTGPVVQLDGNLSFNSNFVSIISKTGQLYPGQSLPHIITAEETRLQMFRKVEFKILSLEPISTLEEAVDILSKDPRNPTACTFVGFLELKAAEDNYHRDSPGCSAKLGWVKAKQYLQTAVEAGSLEADTFYLLGRVHLMLMDYSSAYYALLQALYLNRRSPALWISIGNLYYLVNQYQDSFNCITRAMQLGPSRFEPWYNLGILYGRWNQPDNAKHAISRCLIMNTPSSIADRIRIWLQMIDNPEPFPHWPTDMIECDLRLISDEVVYEVGDGIVVNPLHGESSGSSE